MNTPEDRIDNLMGSFLALEHIILILCQKQGDEELQDTIDTLDLLRVELNQTRDIDALANIIPRKNVLTVYHTEMQTFKNISERLKGILNKRHD